MYSGQGGMPLERNAMQTVLDGWIERCQRSNQSIEKACESNHMNGRRVYVVQLDVRQERLDCELIRLCVWQVVTHTAGF